MNKTTFTIAVLCLVLVIGSCGKQDSTNFISQLCTNGLREMASIEEKIINFRYESASTDVETLETFNTWLIAWDNVYQGMQLNKEISNDEKVRESANTCLATLENTRKDFFSNSALYSTLSSLDLVDVPAVTQHFFNKLQNEFRYFGAHLSSEEQDGLASSVSENSLGITDTSIKDLNQLKKFYQSYSQILGYPDLASFALANSMLTSKFELDAYLKSQEDKYPTPSYEEEIKYFEQQITWSTVVNGLNQISEKLFGMELIESALPNDAPIPKANSENEKYLQYFRVYKDGIEEGNLIFVLDNQEKKFDYIPLRKGINNNQQPSFVIYGGLTKAENQIFVTHQQLISILHQFGHFLHHQLASRQEWFLTAGMETETDFVEAPALLMETWAWKTGKDSVFGLNNSNEIEVQIANFKSIQKYQLLALALVGRELLDENKPVSAIEIERLQELLNSDISSHCVESPLAFHHCLLASEIADELIKPFEQFGMLDRQSGEKLNELLLSRGGTRPAIDMISDYLNRSFSPY